MYNGPAIIVNEMCEIYPDTDRQDVNIIDVACGTGFVGDLVRAYLHINI